MAVADSLSTVGLDKFIPNFSGAGSSVMGIMTWVFLVIIFGAIFIAVVYLLTANLKYNQRAVVFTRIGNKVQKTFVDKAGFFREGKAGDFVFKLKKTKKHLPTPEIQMAPKEYWFFKKTDLEYINIGLEDIDEKLKKAGVHYVKFDMRMSRLAIDKLLRDRLQKPGFWDKHGAMIIQLGFIVVVCIMLVVLFDKLGEISPALEKVATSVKALTDSTVAKATSGVIPA